ncbi:MAG TPA: hypothetical protein DCL98_05800 [Flavobacteriales bacterium]|nr:hypothetical protein [Flavobacteriales bacterium]|tara:strand:- start:130 stop:426 length:297 start_codon:yes stop_codon:yes gene_type:complete
MDWKTWTLQTLQNKYVAATLLAVVWSTFIHDLGMLYVWRESRSLHHLEQELLEVNQRNETLRQRQADIFANPKALERFARERYFMRRPNEEVYRIVND